MNAKIFPYAVVIACVAAAAAGLIWYLFTPPDTTPGQFSGRIEGTTLYPSEYNPAQRVCAQPTQGGQERCVNVPEQDGAAAPAFSIRVSPGRYWVYAIVADPADLGLTESRKAYWTEFVRCGLRATCPSHDRIEVVVTSGQTVTGIMPHDWYINQ